MVQPSQKLIRAYIASGEWKHKSGNWIAAEGEKWSDKITSFSLHDFLKPLFKISVKIARQQLSTATWTQIRF